MLLNMLLEYAFLTNRPTYQVLLLHGDADPVVPYAQVGGWVRLQSLGGSSCYRHRWAGEWVGVWMCG
jgi:hypothetical protein